MTVFDPEMIPKAKRKRWFVKRGDVVLMNAGGFASKSEASDWINSFGWKLDWRSGYLFRLKGDDVAMSIVDRKGIEART